MPKKTVTVLSTSIWYSHPRVPLGWEDVWLRWRVRPGRAHYVHTCALTLISLSDVEAEIHLADEAIRNGEPRGELDRFIRGEEPDPMGWQGTFEALRKENLETRDKLLASKGRFLMVPEDPYTVYTKRLTLDRDEAENMCAWYLRTFRGIRNPRLRWRRPKVVVIPASFYPQYVREELVVDATM